jgi:hypothetical protein
MNLAKKQQGMTFISWVAVLALLAVVVMFVLKVTPAYMESFSVRSTLNSLKEPGESYTGPADIREAIARRFSINNVEDVSGDDIEISPTNGGYEVSIDYEVRTSYMFNIDLVLSFSHRVEVRAR